MSKYLSVYPQETWWEFRKMKPRKISCGATLNLLMYPTFTLSQHHVVT